MPSMAYPPNQGREAHTQDELKRMGKIIVTIVIPSLNQK